MNSDSKIKDLLIQFYEDLDRSLFIDGEYKELANYDRPLPIGHGQTISQPTLVVEMTAQLNIHPDLKVLEIGTGSGYQTAYLAQFAAEVYTVEQITALSLKAQERLNQLGYDNIHFKIGDGSEGWSEFAPYDRIMVTAGAGKLPEPLVQQLKPGGRMIIPIGEKEVQELVLVEKDQKGNMNQKFLGQVLFVEFKGKFGWEI